MAAYVLGNVYKDSSKPHWNTIPAGRHKRDVVSVPAQQPECRLVIKNNMTYILCVSSLTSTFVAQASLSSYYHVLLPDT